MNVLITFTTIGIDAGPFNLYSNVDGYLAAFETNITRAQLLAGFPSANVPNSTTIIRAYSVGVCNNYYDINLLSPTTTTTTIAPTTTTTTTVIVDCLSCSYSELVVGTQNSTFNDYAGVDYNIAQSFNLTGAITRVGLKIYKNAFPDYEIRMKIYSGDITGQPNPPANTLLGSSTNTIKTTSLGSSLNPAFSYFCFSNIPVTGIFTVVIDFENQILHDNANYSLYELDSTNPYPSGGFFYYDGVSWIQVPGYEALFSICYI